MKTDRIYTLSLNLKNILENTKISILSTSHQSTDLTTGYGSSETFHCSLVKDREEKANNVLGSL